MLEKNNTAEGLEKQLDQAETDNKKLRQKISKLEQQKQQDPEFQEVLKKAKTALAKKQFDQYHTLLETFSALKKKAVKRFQKEIAETAALRAEEYEARLDYEDALEQLAEAVEYDPKNGDYWNRYGQTLDTLARYDDAIIAYNKALSIDLKVFGDQHPKVAIRYNNLGAAWYTKGEYDKAIVFYEKALTIFELRLGKNHPNTKIVRGNIEALQGK